MKQCYYINDCYIKQYVGKKNNQIYWRNWQKLRLQDTEYPSIKFLGLGMMFFEK